MQSVFKTAGIHHITAIASSAADNLGFYEGVLGLRLVKQTVNFDDPYTYHLYYGDARSAPGTLLTFFPWENLPRGMPGAGMVTAIAFAVPRTALDFWRQWLRDAGCELKEEERFGEPLLGFTDPHGLPLELVGLASPPATAYWRDGPVPYAHAICGVHSATATLHRLPETEALVVDLMGLAPAGQENNRYRYAAADPQAPGHLWDLVIDPQAPLGRQGGGTVHHIAFRTPDDPTQMAWQARLREAGWGVTEVRDRRYFRSIYFHAPQRLLCEIATDGPGFTVDEAEETLGGSLQLPDALNAMRPEIERRLRPLRPPKSERLTYSQWNPS
jgi:glyoxalase family protein